MASQVGERSSCFCSSGSCHVGLAPIGEDRVDVDDDHFNHDQQTQESSPSLRGLPTIPEYEYLSMGESTSSASTAFDLSHVVSHADLAFEWSMLCQDCTDCWTGSGKSLSLSLNTMLSPSPSPTASICVELNQGFRAIFFLNRRLLQLKSSTMIVNVSIDQCTAF